MYELSCFAKNQCSLNITNIDPIYDPIIIIACFRIEEAYKITNQIISALTVIEILNN